MDTREKILNAIYSAIDELNMTLPAEGQVPKEPTTVLAGSGGCLNSLGVVNLVVETEQQIEETFGVTVNLADKEAATAAQNPFATIQSLVDFVQVKLSNSERGGVAEA